MLKPAINYRQQIYELLPKMPYYSYAEFLNEGNGINLPNINTNTDTCYYWVSVDEQDNLMGYFAYHIKNHIMHIDIAIGFLQKNNLIFGCDWYTIISDYALQYDITSVEWRCFINNPTARYYQRICKIFNGYIKQSNKFYIYTIPINKIKTFIKERDELK